MGIIFDKKTTFLWNGDRIPSKGGYDWDAGVMDHCSTQQALRTPLLDHRNKAKSLIVRRRDSSRITRC